MQLHNAIILSKRQARIQLLRKYELDDFMSVMSLLNIQFLCK